MQYLRNLRPSVIRPFMTTLLAVSALTFATTGCGKGSGKNIKIPGVDGPRVAFVDNKMTLWVVVQGLAIDIGARVQIPHTANSFLEVGPDLQSNGSLFSIGIDIADIKKLSGNGVNVLDPLTLPEVVRFPASPKASSPASQCRYRDGRTWRSTSARRFLASSCPSRWASKIDCDLSLLL